jgi:hypothetical protein
VTSVATSGSETARAAIFGAAEFEESGAAGVAGGYPQGEAMPYPGLRPFRREEVEIFFGRETALDLMVDRLACTKFLAVLGPSGCGKSSLVRTGLYCALERGYLPHAGGRWKIAELNPGRQPTRNLARALAEAIRANAPEAAEADAARHEDLIFTLLKRGPRSVVELGEGKLLADGGNVLIVVDQFEELFRFRDYAGREEAEAFVALLLETARSPLPIHVVITMRSEYLGACSLIPGLAEQVSDGMFLTPRMTRDECREAIQGPPEFRGFDIEPALVARILTELQEFAPLDGTEGLNQAAQLSLQADQLPLMQHLLNRMWRQALAENRPGRLVLTLHDYEEAGRLTGALDAHGADIMEALEKEHGPDIAVTAERVFRALVDGPTIALAVRCPRPLSKLVAAAGGEDKRGDVEAVIEAFRGPDCNFLRTSEPSLDDDVIVDIGHESLIRRWSSLRKWFEAEVESRGRWLRLSQDAELWEKGGLLGGPALRRVTEWWSTERPTPFMAQRYGGDFDNAEAFLRASQEARGRRHKRQKRASLTLRALVIFIIVGLLVAVKIFYWVNLKANEQRRIAQEATTETTITTRALAHYLGRTFCRGLIVDSPPYTRCLTRATNEVRADYLRSQQIQPSAPRPLPGSGGVSVE